MKRKPVPREEENIKVEEEAEKTEVVKKKVAQRGETKESSKRKTNRSVQEKGTEQSEPTKPKKKLERENTFTKEEPAGDISEKKDDVLEDTSTSQTDPNVEPKKYSSLDTKSGKKLDKISKKKRFVYSAGWGSGRRRSWRR